MATVVSSPIETFVAALQAAGGLAGSSFVTCTQVNCTAIWERRVPFWGVQASNVSAGPELWVYEAVANYAGTPPCTTQPLVTAIPFKASANDTVVVRLDTGLYTLVLCSGGPNTATVGLLTCMDVTGINNV
jgi:hypothetical protein